MKSFNKIIHVVGWEERYYLGLTNNIENFQVDLVILLRFEEYIALTNKNYDKSIDFLIDKGIKYHTINLSYKKSLSTWSIIDKKIRENIKSDESVLLDISTMPRHTIWTLSYFVRQYSSKNHFIYYKPKNYTNNWLTREPDKPRLLLKHSGVIDFNLETALIVLTGFNKDRVIQLVEFFNPNITVLGYQKGDQYDNQGRDKDIQNILVDFCKTESFEIDAYSEDFGFNKLEKEIKKLKPNYNILIASLGPKPSAISTYNLFVKYNSIALCYVPTKVFHPDYSIGINEKYITGKIE